MKRPSFQFYPGDWLSSPTVMLMTPEQEGAYIRLLCYDWASDGIPDDDDALATLSRLGEGWFNQPSTDRFNQTSTVIRKCFNQHPRKPGFLTNMRLQAEREKQDVWREKSREGGLRSAESRSKKGSRVVQPNVNHTVEPKGNSSTSSASSTSKIKSRGTLEEFREYFQSIGLMEFDADYTFDKWEGNGWVNGKNPIKDWKATVRQWKTGRFFPSQKIEAQAPQMKMTGRGW